MWENNNENNELNDLNNLGNKLENNSQKHIKNTQNYEIAPKGWPWPIGKGKTDQNKEQGCATRPSRVTLWKFHVSSSLEKFRFSFGTS